MMTDKIKSTEKPLAVGVQVEPLVIRLPFFMRLQSLTVLKEITRGLAFRYGLFSQTKTMLHNRDIVSTKNTIAIEYNEAVNEYNRLRFWFMEKLVNIDV